MKSYTLEELAAHHERTGSVVHRYVTESDYLALAAQVDTLKQSLISTRARGNILHNITMQILQGAELNGSDWDYISESQVAEIEQYIAEIRADAGWDGFVAGYAAGHTYRFANIGDQLADEYADSVRQGDTK